MMKAFPFRLLLAAALALGGAASCGSGSIGGGTGGGSAGAAAGSGAGGSGGGAAAGSGGAAGVGGSGGADSGSGGAGGSATGAAGDGSGGSAGAGTSGSGGASGGATGAGGRGGATGAAGAARGGASGTGTAGAAGGRGGGAGTGVGGAAGLGPGTGGAGGQTACVGSVYNAASPPQALTLSGPLQAHDPAAMVVGSAIYLFATGLSAKTSTNLTTWQSASAPLNPRPAWVAQLVPGANNLWAPDVSFFGGQYHLYYAASTFGSNKSCIGHATKADITTGSWTDHGTVICSNMGTSDNWNAIDPNVVVDDAGTPWLELGSFWSGLKIVKLDTTGARADTAPPTAIADGANGRGSLEGGWIFKNCGYYYLFSSWGACCDGAFDYNIRVGRSTSVTGPYVDKSGTALLRSGGGTLLVQGNGSWSAPGHNAVIVYNNKTYNVYHALAAPSGQNGTATLRIAELAWDADGWPVSGGP